MARKRLDLYCERMPCPVRPERNDISLADFGNISQPRSRNGCPFREIDPAAGKLAEAADLSRVIAGYDHLVWDLSNQPLNIASQSRRARARSNQQRFGRPLDQIQGIVRPISDKVELAFDPV